MATAAISAQPVLRTRNVARFAWIVLAYFTLVVLLGAVVRATGSGGGCGTHWPLCNGDFFPHHPRLATVIEYVHRSTSGVCTVLTAALALWIFQTTPRRHPARKAVLAVVFFLIAEALLGAALVLNHWVENNISTGRVIAQSVHFTNTLLLMGAMAVTAWLLRDTRAPHHAPPTAPAAKPAAYVALAATILVGATGSLAALADTLFPSPTLAAGLVADFAAQAPLLVRMRWLHPGAAALGFLAVVFLLRPQGRKDPLARTVLTLLLLQFVLGIGDVLLLAPTWMQILHLLGADLYWIALVVLASRTLSHTAPSQT